ncbi:hypothetical protein AYO44_07595 [Planctomycetaceae bacterium SCGC AG-212-F19]|nr:hypothetical protein AYO44_07595 [Planctomycetaceae bacterium SCGC AG-212-F19]
MNDYTPGLTAKNVASRGWENVMPHYRVIWEIDAEADSPLPAAEEAFGAMQAADTTATCFTIVETESGDRYVVDLRFDEARAIVQKDGEPPVDYAI